MRCNDYYISLKVSADNKRVTELTAANDYFISLKVSVNNKRVKLALYPEGVSLA